MLKYEGFQYFLENFYEHLKVRKSVGIFDVSHMGEFLVEGDNATSNVLIS
jgi:glycine cleavage system aminomethyltransferase T